MKIFNPLIPAAFVACLFISCGGEDHDHDAHHGDSAAVAPKDTTPVTVNEETKIKFDFAVANIPSPVELINTISGWGVEYHGDYLNDSKKSSSYTSEFSKAITLGIYNIDLSYAMVNGQGGDVMKYMKTSMVQSDGLGLKGAVDNMMGKRAEANLGNKDSLLKIMDHMLVKSDDFLRTHERVYAASVIFAGSWVESLYLACKIGGGSSDPAVKEKMYKLVWDQRFYLENLVKILEDFKDKKEVAELNKDFNEILALIKPIRDSKEMNETNFKTISDKIFALRERLTK